MTTSGITAWSLTARDIIKTALEDSRVIALGDDPTAAELAACVTRLNAMLKSWQAKGVTMWRENDLTVTIPANTASVALSAGVSDVADARLILSATHQRPMTRYERADYNELPNKVQTGQPIGFYVSEGSAGRIMNVWPVPVAAMTIRLDAGRVPDTVTDASQTVDVPEMWQEMLYANLALRCAGIFGAELTQEQVARAQMLEMAMFDYDRPDSYYLGPWSDDYRA